MLAAVLEDFNDFDKRLDICLDKRIRFFFSFKAAPHFLCGELMCFEQFQVFHTHSDIYMYTEKTNSTSTDKGVSNCHKLHFD